MVGVAWAIIAFWQLLRARGAATKGNKLSRNQGVGDGGRRACDGRIVRVGLFGRGFIDGSAGICWRVASGMCAAFLAAAGMAT